MSTRCSILIHISEPLIGTKVKFNPNDLKNQKDWGFERCDDVSEEITLASNYLGIYCHWDGYPNGVGRTLCQNFSNFDDALNLIIGGDCSVIDNDRVLRYATRKNEKWEYIKPRPLNSILPVSEDSEYIYVFLENRWYIKINKFLILIPTDVSDLNSYLTGYLDGIEDSESFSQTLRQMDWYDADATT